MVSLDEAGNRAASLQMNAELRHAQLELLSAQCATDRLRLRYSVEQIGRHAQRDILRKAWASASALYEYYSSIVRLAGDSDGRSKQGSPSPTEPDPEEARLQVADYLRQQREFFHPNSHALESKHRQVMDPFFSRNLLDRVRTVTLKGQRIANPAFYNDARCMGIKNLPDMTHMASLTFEDVLVFHEEIAARTLFHALVHAVQFEVLDLERYSELYVRGFLRTRSHISVPLEAHAFQLESKFAERPTESFSVEEKVRLWTNQGRY
jgi:hypothetical protein